MYKFAWVIIKSLAAKRGQQINGVKKGLLKSAKCRIKLSNVSNGVSGEVMNINLQPFSAQ